MFSDERPLERGPVNIHEVLEHVRRVAQTGFARHVRVRESYDPSLPPVLGNRDLLIQALLNLVKNAAEAAGEGPARWCSRPATSRASVWRCPGAGRASTCR